MPTTHVVVQGDCLSSIAKRYGYRDWRTVWEDAINEELRKLRKNPNILFPGDKVGIPDHEERIEHGATERTHRFVVRQTTTTLRIVLEAPRELAYELTVEGGTNVSATTDGKSAIEHEIRADARSGRLVVWPANQEQRTHENGQHIQLHLGALDPVEENTGVQARLTNLDLYHGSLHGELDAETRRAIRAFEELVEREPTGVLTDELRTLIRQRHDGA